VKLDKLAKQLRRDLLSNPKKAAALGLMLLVAMYFWAPLAWKWIAKPDKKAAKADSTNLILEDDPALAPAKGKPGLAASFRWEKVRQLQVADPRMTTAVRDAKWRDPFAVPLSQIPLETPVDDPLLEGNAQQTAIVPPPVEIGPEQAGLSLESVMIGPRGSSAIISGESYREGQKVFAAGSDKVKLAAAVEFVLVRVDRQGVEVERGGKKWRLDFEQPKLARGDEIEPAAGNQPDR